MIQQIDTLMKKFIIYKYNLEVERERERQKSENRERIAREREREKMETAESVERVHLLHNFYQCTTRIRRFSIFCCSACQHILNFFQYALYFEEFFTTRPGKKIVREAKRKKSWLPWNWL